MPDEEKRARGARIRALREAMKLTQDQVADRGGFPRTYVSKFESGENAASTSQAITMLAKGFDAEEDDIKTYLAGVLDLRALLAQTERWRADGRKRTFVVPEYRDRVFYLAGKLDKTAAEAQAVADGLAAFTGEITDKEIARRFEPQRAAKIAPTIVQDDDDLGGGLSAVPKLAPKGKPTKKGGKKK